MESRTSEALGVLLRADGDGVLTPLVLAMVEGKRFQRVGRGAQGVLLHTDVLWTSLREGPLIFLVLQLTKTFRRLK